MKFPLSLLAASTLLAALPALAAESQLTCADSRIPNMTPAQRVYAAQVMQAHLIGTEIPGENYDGAGFCYGAEKGITTDIVRAFEMERVAFGRGEAYNGYLIKNGERHSLYIGDQHLPQTESQCTFTIERDKALASAAMGAASVNSYDPATLRYSFRASVSELPAEEREIRAINGGKDITVFFAKDLRKFHIVCIFPRR